MSKSLFINIFRMILYLNRVITKTKFIEENISFYIYFQLFLIKINYLYKLAKKMYKKLMMMI